MYLTIPLKSLINLVSNLNSAIKKGSNSLLCKVYKNDFKYLDCLSAYGYIFYTAAYKHITPINNRMEKNFYFIQIFFNNFLINSSAKPCFKRISIVSKPVHIVSVNNLGIFKNNVTYSFLQSNKDVVYFLSTHRGILPHYLCKKLGIGGIVVFKIL
jgi:ribosomal protein S8